MPVGWAEGCTLPFRHPVEEPDVRTVTFSRTWRVLRLRWDGRLREPRAGQPGHVAFREGFLEEAISKMNPDR